MKWRLREGQGEAIYEIGVEDNGLLTGLNKEELQSSLQTVQKMAQKYVDLIIDWKCQLKFTLFLFYESATYRLLLHIKFY